MAFACTVLRPATALLHAWRNVAIVLAKAIVIWFAHRLLHQLKAFHLSTRPKMPAMKRQCRAPALTGITALLVDLCEANASSAMMVLHSSKQHCVAHYKMRC